MMAPGRWQLAKAQTALLRGGIIAYPTEAVWGLGCDPFNPDAVLRLLALKKRSVNKGLILVASDLSQLEPLLGDLSVKQRLRLADELSDEESGMSITRLRPTTWLIPSGGVIPQWITGTHDTVAIRVSKHPTVSALCQLFGGLLVSTSANTSGRTPARNQLSARCYFGHRVNAYVSGATFQLDFPSQIRDLMSGELIR